MTKLDWEARKQMQLQLGAQSAEAWMLDAAVVISMEAQNSPRWKLRKECHQLRVANTQCQGLVVAAANLSMPRMLS